MPTDRINSVLSTDAPSLCFSPPVVSSSTIKQVCASVIGGGVSTLLLNPLQVIKLRLQYAIPQKAVTLSARAQVSIPSIAMSLYRVQGFQGFYSGVGVSLVQTLPSTVLYMLSYENIKPHIEGISNGWPYFANLSPAFAGGLARVITVTAVAPLELIKTIRTSGTSNLRPFEIARDIIRKNGVLGLYSGWFPTLLRDTPYSMLYWLSLEKARPIIDRMTQSPSAPPRQRSEYSPFTNFTSGAFGGLIAALITHPFDVIKTQQQLSTMNIPVNVSLRPTNICVCCGHAIEAIEKIDETSMFEIGRDVIREGGVRALFRGLSLRLMTVIPAGAIMISVYEIVKNM